VNRIVCAKQRPLPDLEAEGNPTADFAHQRWVLQIAFTGRASFLGGEQRIKAGIWRAVAQGKLCTRCRSAREKGAGPEVDEGAAIGCGSVHKKQTQDEMRTRTARRASLAL
jgi:hypothetical protein